MNRGINQTNNQLINSLKTHIADVSSVYNNKQLLMLHTAIHGEDYIIPIEQRDKEEVVIVKKEVKQILNTNRKKVRIDLTIDNSYAEPLTKHLKGFDNLKVVEIKTGMAIKNVCGGYLSNVVNYNELRTINGVLHGNLYFNVIRCEEDYDYLKIDRDIKWFRGFALIPKVSIYDVIEYLNEEAMVYLKALSTRGNKRRLTNAKRLSKIT